MFTPMVQTIFQALAAPIESNDQQAIREKQLMQRQYFHFIAAIVTNNLTEVLSSQEPVVLQEVMRTVMQGAVEFPDPVVNTKYFMFYLEFQRGLKYYWFYCDTGSKSMFLDSEETRGDMGWPGWSRGLPRFCVQWHRSCLFHGSDEAIVWYHRCSNSACSQWNSCLPSCSFGEKGTSITLYMFLLSLLENYLSACSCFIERGIRRVSTKSLPSHFKAPSCNYSRIPADAAK